MSARCEPGRQGRAPKRAGGTAEAVENREGAGESQGSRSPSAGPHETRTTRRRGLRERSPSAGRRGPSTPSRLGGSGHNRALPANGPRVALVDHSGSRPYAGRAQLGDLNPAGATCRYPSRSRPTTTSKRPAPSSSGVRVGLGGRHGIVSRWDIDDVKEGDHPWHSRESTPSRLEAWFAEGVPTIAVSPDVEQRHPSVPTVRPDDRCEADSRPSVPSLGHASR